VAPRTAGRQQACKGARRGIFTRQSNSSRPVVSELLRLDPDGSRIGRVLRETLDQLYDGQRTGRYRLDQLHKTEKTHCGTLVEINLHREFAFEDGNILDYRISGIEVDCKYSQALGGWMIPPEAEDHLCLLCWADDTQSKWSLGVLRVGAALLNAPNRDRKRTLNINGRNSIRWIFDKEELPPNALLHLPPADVQRIFAMGTGQRRVNELFRLAQGMRIGRGVVATVAQQHDYMKRLRANGGARTTLQADGIVLLGQYQAHVRIAQELGLPLPSQGETVSARLTQAPGPGPGTAYIAGAYWRLALPQDPVIAAPELPRVAE
jgi:hypothetical protein